MPAANIIPLQPRLADRAGRHVIPARVVRLADACSQRAVGPLQDFKRALELVAAWDTHRAEAGVVVTKARASYRAALQAQEGEALSEWPAALHGRWQRALLASVGASRERQAAVRHMYECRVTVGGALHLLPRPEARKVYGETFGGLTAQQRGQRVASLVRDYRHSRRSSGRVA